MDRAQQNSSTAIRRMISESATTKRLPTVPVRSILDRRTVSLIHAYLSQARVWDRGSRRALVRLATARIALRRPARAGPPPAEIAIAAAVEALALCDGIGSDPDFAALGPVKMIADRAAARRRLEFLRSSHAGRDRCDGSDPIPATMPPLPPETPGRVYRRPFDFWGPMDVVWHVTDIVAARLGLLRRFLPPPRTDRQFPGCGMAAPE